MKQTPWAAAGFVSLTASVLCAQEPSGRAEPRKSYVIPAAEIVGFEFLLNQYDRHLVDDSVYGTDGSTISRNLHRGWLMDRDPFGVNQIGHPYSGGTYHGFARSAGLTYWESSLYTFGGSALWEVAGETERPSLNDQLTTGIGGSFVGEALFRTAGWVLQGGGENPGFARELAAAVVSPPTAFNRHAFGDRFRFGYPHGEPAVSSRLGLGARTRTHVSHQVLSNDEEENTTANFDFAIDYGTPGKPGYRYEQPFDQFHFEVLGRADPDNKIERAIVRGLLLGHEYRSREALSGVVGFYGGYDYVSPGVFRVASTSASFGTTAQWRASQAFTLQGAALAGAGFGAAGTIADAEVDRDYHYGVIPQGTAELRILFADAAMLQLTRRDYHVLGISRHGTDNIAQSELALTLRVYGPHAVRVEYVSSQRSAHYRGDPDQEQGVESICVLYALLGGTRLQASQ